MATDNTRRTMDHLFPDGYRGLPNDDVALKNMARQYAIEALSTVPTGRLSVDELLHQAGLAEQMLGAGFGPEAYQRLQAMGVGQGYMPQEAVDVFNPLIMSLYDDPRIKEGGLRDQVLGMYQRTPQGGYMTTQDIARELQFAMELANRGMTDQAYAIMEQVRPQPQGGLMDPRVRNMFSGASQFMAERMTSSGATPLDIQNMIAGLSYAPNRFATAGERLGDFALNEYLREVLAMSKLNPDGTPSLTPEGIRYLGRVAADDRNLLQEIINSVFGY